MKLLAGKIDKASLSQLGDDAVSLLKNRDFPSLADRFGYALANERQLAMAIEEDLQTCIASCQGLSAQQNAAVASIFVNYFKPNDSGLFAVVECVFDVTKGCRILAELVVTSKGNDKYVTLEQISPAAAQA